MPKLQTCPFNTGDMVVTPVGEFGVVEEIGFYHSWLKGRRTALCTVRVPENGVEVNLGRFATFHERYTFVTYDADKLKIAKSAEEVLGDEYFA